MELPRYHRLRPTFYRLEASRCAACGQIHFPPRELCLACSSPANEPLPLSGRGRIVSCTRLWQPARGFHDLAGGVTALIELQEGIKVTAQLTDVDPEDVTVGQEVEMVVRRLLSEAERGPIVYGYKFRPVLKTHPAAEAT
jgi:uncharacterized OB-fold protein